MYVPVCQLTVRWKWSLTNQSSTRTWAMATRTLFCLGSLAHSLTTVYRLCRHLQRRLELAGSLICSGATCRTNNPYSLLTSSGLVSSMILCAILPWAWIRLRPLHVDFAIPSSQFPVPTPTAVPLPSIASSPCGSTEERDERHSSFDSAHSRHPKTKTEASHYPSRTCVELITTTEQAWHRVASSDCASPVSEEGERLDQPRPSTISLIHLEAWPWGIPDEVSVVVNLLFSFTCTSSSASTLSLSISSTSQ